MLRLNYLIFIIISTLSTSAFCGDVNKIKILLLHGGQIYENNPFSDEHIDSTMEHAKIYAYYPTKIAPRGTYEIFIKFWDKYYEAYIERKIGQINYNGYSKKWNVDKKDIFWNLYTKGHQSVPSFKIYTKYYAEGAEIGDTSITASSTTQFTNGWIFVVYFKTRDEKLNGKTEDPRFYDKVTEEFCTQWVNTTGESRTIGAICPFDTSKNKHMDMCLNWRRLDLIGKKCLSLKIYESRDSSIIDFCGINQGAEDCRCVNRHLYPDYINHTYYHLNTDDNHDFCLYKPCNSGDYLIKTKESLIQCKKYTMNLNQDILKANYIKCIMETENLEDIKNCLRKLELFYESFK